MNILPVTDTNDLTAATFRTDLVALLAAGVLRLAAERAGGERKRMRQPEPRIQSPAITPSLPSRYELLSPADQSVYRARQEDAQPDGPAGRDAHRGPRRRRGGAEPDHEGDAR